MDEIEKRCVNLIAKHFRVAPTDKILDLHFIRDLGADSMDAVQFILLCENEFALTIPSDFAAICHTPRAAIDFIRKHI